MCLTSFLTVYMDRMNFDNPDFGTWLLLLINSIATQQQSKWGLVPMLSLMLHHRQHTRMRSVIQQVVNVDTRSTVDWSSVNWDVKTDVHQTCRYITRLLVI